MVVVVKIGGDLLKGGEVHRGLLDDIKETAEERGIVLVHGGGDEVTEIAEKLGKQQIFVVSPQGFKSRYTDRETAEIYTMVIAGRINKRIVATLQANGIKAVGLSGFDGWLLKAERKKRIVIVDEKGRKRFIDGGYTGRIVEVNVDLLNLMLKAGYVPVISPVAMGVEGEPLNVDGDRTTAAVAAALKAEAVIFLTDVEGLLLDGKLVEKVKVDEVEQLLSRIGPGMSTKIHAAVNAVKNGVSRAIIASGFVDNPISLALAGKGTVVEV
ncbi:MAG: [LysW]-aminoadipate/[LysW]-glutamate kinase [Candidatus Verstraetearchaeota archaeon]|nr:[LysW]-aminoadipate/[LysW]-glutamate kinase [Candidatus Verstraetearchaeota archaeon]